MKTQANRLFYSSTALLILMGSVTLWGQAVSLSLFINGAGLAALAPVLAIEACLSAVLIFLFEQLRRWIPKVGLILLGGLVVVAVLWLAEQTLTGRPYYGALYLAYAMSRDLVQHYHWRYILSYYMANRRHQIAQLILYSRAQVLVAGLALWFLPSWIAHQYWVDVWMGGLLVGLALILLHADEFAHLPRREEHAPPSWEGGRPLALALRNYFRPPLIYFISLTSAGLVALLTLLLYQQLHILARAFDAEVALLRWFGISALLSIPLMVGLWMAAKRLAHRAGIRPLHRAYWYANALGLVSSYGLPFLPSALWAEMLRNQLYYAFYTPTRFQMTSLLPSNLQVWTHSIGEGLVEALGRLGVALLLAVWVALGLPNWGLVFVGALILGGVAYTYLQAFDRYQAAQEASLAAGQYGFLRQQRPESFLTDQQIIQTLLHELATLPPDHRDALLIGEALAETGHTVCFEALVRYWQGCQSHSLQAELLLLLADGWTTRQAKIAIQDLVAQALDSPDPKLRRAALQIMGLYPELLDSYRVATLLLDKDPSVNTLACQLLLQHPSRPLAKAALNQLLWLAKTGQPRVRAFAVDALVKGGGDRYGEWNIPLAVEQFQRDSSARVRLGALPAANTAQLIQSVQDSSPAVRLLAIEHLRRAPFYWRTRRALRQALERFPIITPQGFQIQQTLAYWHLLGAIATLAPRSLQEELPRYLEEGFKHLDWLTSARIALHGLDHPQLAALIAQLELERIHLLQAIVRVVGQLHGQHSIQQAARQLALAKQPNEQLAAIQPLTQALGQLAGERLAALLSAPRQHEQWFSESPGWQVVYPPEVMRGLLTQGEDWFGILVLYSVIGLPQDLTDAALIQALIQRCQHSSDDALREALWPLQRALESQQETPQMLSTIERMIFLRKVHFFENLRLDQLRTLANLCEERTLAPGEWLLQQGEAGDSLAVLVEGSVSVLDAAGVELSQHQAGDVLGEISLFDGGLRSANAQAIAPTLALVIYREALYNALADDPAIAMDLLRAMAQLVRQTTTRLNQVVANSEVPSMD